MFVCWSSKPSCLVHWGIFDEDWACLACDVANELDCYATQHQLESNRPSLIHTLIKPEQDNNVPASDVCVEHSFKEEMCFDQSSLDVSENNVIECQFFTDESKKNKGAAGSDQGATIYPPNFTQPLPAPVLTYIYQPSRGGGGGFTNTSRRRG
uniref:Uncharacterized protein n=1 Tax=Timema bartmani TaxID=61472 RepID=A0A7R9F8U9_9NEOP|nr:unnamed protein product [Timema bartmani]